MANLNWYWIYVPYLDEPDRQAESALRAGYNKVVFKAEADKVIAEKDKKIDLYKRGWEESDKINASIYAELRHQKYKRCLAMAEKCESMCYWFSVRFDHHELVDNVKWEIFDRWRLRWTKLAEKFKKAK